MTHTFQVTFDCANPHRLAAWWAQFLGWEVEPSNEAFIRQMIEAGHATADDAIEYEGVLVWKTGQAINPPAGVIAPRVLFQWVPEGKSVKNRVHLDVRAAVAADIPATREWLLANGAQEIGRGQQGPHSWVVYQDPEGNEFCL